MPQTNEFDVDTPADLELLGGIVAEEVPEIEAQPADPEPEVPAEEVAVEEKPAQAEETASEEDPAPAKRDTVIPRARFDEVNAKLHAEREETERLRAELNARSTPAPAAAVDVDALEDEYFDALLEGDKDRAKKVRATINAEIYSRAEAASTAAAAATITEREAKSAFTQAVEQTVTAYPFLNSQGPETNAEAIAEVVEWRDFYINKGDTPARALLKAADKVAPLYAPEKVVEPADPVPLTDKRKQSALATAARVASTQPPRADAGIGNRAIPAGDSIVGNQDRWEKASDAERLQYLQ